MHFVAYPLNVKDRTVASKRRETLIKQGAEARLCVRVQQRARLMSAVVVADNPISQSAGFIAQCAAQHQRAQLVIIIQTCSFCHCFCNSSFFLEGVKWVGVSNTFFSLSLSYMRSKEGRMRTTPT